MANSAVTVIKQEWVKDAQGNHQYDDDKLAKFRAKQVRAMKRQNEKIKAAQALGRKLDYSICDPEEFADMMVKMYQHHFRQSRPVVLK
ncbi:MAG: hypothetical protein ABJH04_08150 [Cyclobacteriaceae bacterium]